VPVERDRHFKAAVGRTTWLISRALHIVEAVHARCAELLTRSELA